MVVQKSHRTTEGQELEGASEELTKSLQVKEKALTKQLLKAVRCLNMQAIPTAGDLTSHTDIIESTGAERRLEPQWPKPYDHVKGRKMKQEL